MKHKKLKQSDELKIKKRFDDVSIALQSYTLDELRSIWKETKMSSTDSYALQEVVTIKLNSNAIRQ